jgi:hypothetical protein
MRTTRHRTLAKEAFGMSTAGHLAVTPEVNP